MCKMQAVFETFYGFKSDSSKNRAMPAVITVIDTITSHWPSGMMCADLITICFPHYMYTYNSWEWILKTMDDAKCYWIPYSFSGSDMHMILICFNLLH